MTTDSVEPNSMHQAVWKSTVAIFEPTVRRARSSQDSHAQTPWRHSDRGSRIGSCFATASAASAARETSEARLRANRLDVRARDRQDHGASMACGPARRFSTKED